MTTKNKTFKSVVALLMAIVTIISTMITMSTKVSAATYINTRLVSEVAQMALTKVGTKWANGMCESFAETMYRNAGISVAYKGCAAEACDSWWQSTNSSNIPIGAMVFASSSSTHNGHNAGHIGIYVGDGYVVHGGAGDYVRKDTLSAFLSGRGYWGWGIGGYYLDYNSNNRRVTANISVYSSSSMTSRIGSVNKNEIVLWTGNKSSDGRYAQITYYVTGSISQKTGWVESSYLTTFGIYY